MSILGLLHRSPLQLYLQQIHPIQYKTLSYYTPYEIGTISKTFPFKVTYYLVQVYCRVRRRGTSRVPLLKLFLVHRPHVLSGPIESRTLRGRSWQRGCTDTTKSGEYRSIASRKRPKFWNDSILPFRNRVGGNLAYSYMARHTNGFFAAYCQHKEIDYSTGFDNNRSVISQGIYACKRGEDV